MNDDDRLDEVEERLLRRMQAADPAQTRQTDDSSRIAQQVDDAMSKTLIDPASRTRRWAPAMAAAATVAVFGGGAYTFLGGDLGGDLAGNDPAGTPGATAMTLKVPSGTGTSIGSCVPFDVRYLRDMPVAFSASATEVHQNGVTLEVDRWYKGGDADIVHLANYDLSTASVDGFIFEEGRRYLITATDRTVNYCGYSAPWNQERAEAFDKAFNS